MRVLPLLLALCAIAGAAHAEDHGGDRPLDSGRLLLTQGVSTVEGASGGGLASWATIAGYETRNAIGGNAHATYVDLPDYTLRTYGAAVGFYNRIELSYARQEFDTGGTGAKLGLGRGFTFDQDIYGAKLRLFGDAVYDQDRWTPQVSVGVQHKRNDQAGVIHYIGGKRADGTDYYVSATKVLLAQSLVLNATARATKANQLGILGFGGDKSDDYSAQFEGSAGYLVSKRLAIGGEYRSKPDNLSFAKENAWADIFAAYAVNKHLSVTAAYADVGAVATFRNQRGLYLSVQAGF